MASLFFRRIQHDFGSKTVLGKTGNLDGNAVLDIILSQPRTAYFIAEKIYRFLVNETVDSEKVKWLADRFYKNDYSIELLLDDIFMSEWLYEEKNIGSKIKSPIELLAGIQRMIPMKLENNESLMLIQRLLGQVLFYPPNVAGWPGGRAWIDSSTLMVRLRLPQLLNDNDEFNLAPKSDDDQMMGREDGGLPQLTIASKVKGMRTINANLDWKHLHQYLSATERSKLENNIAGVLLQTNRSVSAALVRSYADESDRESFIESVTLQYMSTPEYQLC
ncbi:MAG: DUF1800 domain-containing protein [Chitinophagaceae bacterium]|nr:DUF1800 domain-containing protein [Chitinophagaceae bacterium]